MRGYLSSLPPSGVTCVSQRKSEYVRESMWIRLNNYSVLKGKKERGTVGVLVVSVGPSDSRLFSSLSLEVCPWNGERERRRKGSFLNNRWERILDQTRSRIRPRLSPPDKKGVRVDWKETRNTFSNKYGFIKS